jgi:hypothetical protein
LKTDAETKIQRASNNKLAYLFGLLKDSPGRNRVTVEKEEFEKKILLSSEKEESKILKLELEVTESLRNTKKSMGS